MKKIYIVKGNRRFFEKEIANVKNVMTFDEIVTLSDNLRQLSSYTKIIEECFCKNVNIIAYTNSYSGITEGGVQSLFAIIKPFYSKIDNIYLQNPPKAIEDSVTRSNEDYSIVPMKFKPISLKNVNTIYKNINSKIIGQDKAKEDLVTAIYKKARTKDKKPLVLMFYGPSGVGKTETAKFINRIIEGNEIILRKQMSMFSSSEYFTYMFGGKHNEITLSKELLERKSNIILFDEFDKCNSIFYSSFYQMFDEGCFEDRNYNVNLDNAIIICTSNFKTKEEIRKAVGDPIFYRFDKFIEFTKLSKNEQKIVKDKIVKKQFDKFNNIEKKKFKLEELNLYYEKKLIGKIVNFRQAESLISEDIWKKLCQDYFENQ